MDGTKSGTASNTYPKDWVASLGSNPTGGASPLTVTTIPTMQTYNGVGIAGYPTYGSFASNELGGGIYTYYTSTSSGLINGSVTTHLDGQLVYYFLVQWSGGGTPTSPMPSTISLLLNTNLFASVQLSYGSSKATSGLSASASASDKVFNETASSSGPTSVIGYHLVQASVSALTATTGIAETYLNGSVDQTASDTVPAGVYVAGHGYQPPNGSSPAVANGTMASANSEVAAGVKLDSREVRIFGQMGTTYHKGPTGAPVANAADANGTETDDTLAPLPNKAIIVNPVGWAGGPWGANSTYKWSLIEKAPMMNISTGAGSSGVVSSNGTIPGQPVTYYSPVPFTGPISSNHHLVVTDGVDGATEAADYFINFHSEYENLVSTSDSRMTGTSVRVTASVFSGPLGGTFTAPITNPVSVSVICVPSTGAGQYAAKQYNAIIGATYSSLVPRSSPGYTMPFNKYCWVEDQPYWRQVAGTVDNYEAQGYVAIVPFVLNCAYNPGPNLIDYNEQLVVSSNPPTN